MMQLDSIRPNPDQPRRHFDTAALQELADSIRELGVLQPIAVTPDGMIVAGERRWRAAQMAGLDEVPVVIVEAGDEELFVRSVAENVNRRDMTLIEEADAYGRLHEKGWSVERIARLLGKRPQDIRWKLDLAGLDPAVRGVVATGQLPPDLTWHLSQISGNRQIEVVRKWAAGSFESASAAIAYCEATKLADAQEFMFSIEEIPAVTARQEKARAQTRSKLSAVGRAMEALDEIFADEDAEMAAKLGPEAARLREELDLLAKAVARLKRRAVKVEQMVNAGVGQASLLP